MLCSIRLVITGLGLLKMRLQATLCTICLDKLLEGQTHRFTIRLDSHFTVAQIIKQPANLSTQIFQVERTSFLRNGPSLLSSSVRVNTNQANKLLSRCCASRSVAEVECKGRALPLIRTRPLMSVRTGTVADTGTTPLPLGQMGELVETNLLRARLLNKPLLTALHAAFSLRVSAMVLKEVVTYQVFTDPAEDRRLAPRLV